MKVIGLEGEYCPTCAGVLTSVKANRNNIIVMCGSVCASTLQQSGDYERLNKPKPYKPEETEKKSPEVVVEEKMSEPKRQEKAPTESLDKRSEPRDDGEHEQHLAEKAGLVPEPK